MDKKKPGELSSDRVEQDALSQIQYGDDKQRPIVIRNEHKYGMVESQADRVHTASMKTVELGKNVFVTGSVTRSLLSDPTKWLEDHEKFPVRFVGGLHNLSDYDKKAWAENERSPLRIVETGTGREEVWFPVLEAWEAIKPVFISLDARRYLTSHLKFSKYRPTLKQYLRIELPGSTFKVGKAEFFVWYHENEIHRIPDRDEEIKTAPAVLSTKMTAPILDTGVDYIDSVFFSSFQEYWEHGKWENTKAGRMTIIFSNDKLNTPEIQGKAVRWIEKHCHGGFFPFGDPIFRDKEDEFLFVTDICNQA